MNEYAEFISKLSHGIENIIFKQALKKMSPYSPETVIALKEFVISCHTETLRLAVVRQKGGELPIAEGMCHNNDGTLAEHFPVTVSVSVRAQQDMLKAGFVQEVVE